MIRCIPVDQALLSYGLGAAGLPIRFALVGNAAMLTHMIPTVYFGAVAAHVTRMASRGHRDWEIQGIILLLGLGVCVWLTLQITHRAWRAIGDMDGKVEADSP